MYRVAVTGFGAVDQLHIEVAPDPIPAGNQVVVRLTSIGMNHADLMARRGEYKLSSGSPPFTPGIEGGGYIATIGEQVSDRTVGQRVILTLDAPYRHQGGAGTYQSHYLTTVDKTIPVPAGIPDELLGALWLPYLTAWGCLVWRQNLQPGQIVMISAASSSVAIAAAQVVKQQGGIAIGTTTSPSKLEKLRTMPEAQFDHLVLTGSDRDWRREIRQVTKGLGPTVIFDPIAAGEFLNTEIRVLAAGGTIWIYGLLGRPDVVDVTPLIRKGGAIRGWLLNELGTDATALQTGYQHVLERVAQGVYQLPIAATFPLREVRQAHAEMEKGEHIGKLILIS